MNLSRNDAVGTGRSSTKSFRVRSLGDTDIGVLTLCLRCFFALLLSLNFFAARAHSEVTSTNLARNALVFRNGDILLGKLESIHADKSVVWRRSDVLQPMDFFGTNIAEIKFSLGKNSASPVTNACRVHLSNGDSLEGGLLEVNSEKVTLATSFAGTMTFPRKTVTALEALPQEGRMIFSGPTGVEGWTMGKVTAAAPGEAGEWKYTNGAFYATRSASIARDLKLPEVASIQFDLAWKGMLQAAVALYTSHMQPIPLANKDLEPDFGGFYSLQLNSFMATLMPVKKHAPLVYLGQVPVPAFNRKNRAHLELLVNRPGNRIVFFVDGLLVKEWSDPDGFAGTGTGMRFVHQQNQGAIKLSNLRIAEWNGKLEQQSTNAAVLKEALAKLLNGDKVSGKLELFRGEKFTFSAGKTKLDIPFSRVMLVKFPLETNENAIETAASVRAYFSSGGRVTFRLESWDQAALGNSPYFGRATFAPDTFERVELYPILIGKNGGVTNRPNLLE